MKVSLGSTSSSSTLASRMSRKSLHAHNGDQLLHHHTQATGRYIRRVLQQPRTAKSSTTTPTVILTSDQLQVQPFSSPRPVHAGRAGQPPSA